MADILIPNMKKPLKGMYEEIRVWDDGRVDIYDCESECYIPTTKAIELPPHGRLVDIDRMIADGRKCLSPVCIESMDDLADFLETYADLDKTDHTVVVGASNDK